MLGCILKGSTFDHVTLRNVDFGESDMEGVDFRHARDS